MNILRYFLPFEFWVQLFVLEMLMSYPLKKRKLFLLRLALCFAIISIVCWYWRPRGSTYFWLLKFGTIFIMSILMIIFSHKISIRNAIFCCVGAYAMQHTGNAVYTIFMNAIPYNANNYLYFYLLSYIPLAVSYALMYFIFIRKFHEQESFIVKNNVLASLVVVVLTTTLILSNLISEFGGRNLPVGVNITIKIYTIFCCVLALTIQAGLFTKNKLERDLEILKHIMHSEQKQHRISQENISLINIKCHDIKHQIASLKNLNLQGLKDEYISELEQAVLVYDNIAKTGNTTLDTVLTEKKLMCDRYKIKFAYIVDGEKLDFMQSHDIYSLFGNALDNAFESVKKLNDENKRIINLSVSAKDHILKINLENYYEENITFENELPKTSKENNNYHGYGLKSIKFTVEKYNGNMIIDTSDNLFSLIIIIPLQT